MKYFFVSDVHGQYDRLMTSLKAAQFDLNKDTIVSLGDPFDRGEQSYEVLQFLMSCPNRILVWGNHDHRLKRLITGIEAVRSADYHNGVLETMQSFCKDNKNIRNIQLGIHLLKTDSDLEMRYRLLWQYFSECIWGIEFKDMIAVHGWVPGIVYDLNGGKYEYILPPDWREISTAEDWYDASWAHTADRIAQGLFPDKKLLIGHWHAWRLRYRSIAEVPEKINFGVYEANNYIAIDGCSNAADGVVNVYVYETDEAPKLFDIR